MELAEKIQMQRKKEGLSQEAFAEKMGVSRQAVSKWELGITKPDVDKIVMMSDLFGVSTDYLLKNQVDNEQKERVIYYREVIPWEVEKKSRHQLFGLPLYHIYFSGTRSGGRVQMKMKTAKGIFAIGNTVSGIREILLRDANFTDMNPSEVRRTILQEFPDTWKIIQKIFTMW